MRTCQVAVGSEGIAVREDLIDGDVRVTREAAVTCTEGQLIHLLLADWYERMDQCPDAMAAGWWRVAPTTTSS